MLHRRVSRRSILAGAGLKTGQTIGRTDAPVGTVTDHPIGGIACRAARSELWILWSQNLGSRSRSKVS